MYDYIIDVGIQSSETHRRLQDKLFSLNIRWSANHFTYIDDIFEDVYVVYIIDSDQYISYIRRDNRQRAYDRVNAAYSTLPIKPLSEFIKIKLTYTEEL